MSLTMTRPVTRAPPIREWHIIHSLVVQTEWIREVRGILAGTWRFAKPFRNVIFIILAFNLAIALLDAVFALGMSTANDAIARAIEGKLTYGEVVSKILWPNVPLILGSTALEYVREHITIKYLTSKFLPYAMRISLPNKHVSLGKGHGRTAVVKAGCDSEQSIVLMLSRDPSYVARGLLVLGMMTFFRRDIAEVIFIGLACEAAVQWYMNISMRRALAWQNKAAAMLVNIGFRYFDGSHRRTMNHARFERVAAIYQEATATTGIRMLQLTRVREFLKAIVPLGVMVMFVPDALRGQFDFQGFTFWVAYYLRAGDPVYVFFTLQQLVLNNRANLYWFGLMLPEKMKFIKQI